MPTRGQKAAADRATTKEQNASKIPKIHDDSTNPPADVAQKPPKSAAETIGGRLRKRRRTDSSRLDNSSPPNKRIDSKKPITDSIPQSQLQSDPSPPTQDVQDNLVEDEQPLAHTCKTIPANSVGGDFGGQQLSTSEPANDDRNETAFMTGPPNIINLQETIDNHYASPGYNGFSMPDNGPFHHVSAGFTLRIQSLPVLENLATQVLEIMAKSTYHEILNIATKVDTDPGQAYATLKSLFDHTKKIYSLQDHFLNPYELGLVDGGQINIIRKANIATFVSSVFGSQDVGFYHLNENFLDTFVTGGNRLLKSQAQLFLELKTQAYISAVQNTDRSREEIIEDLFPQNLEEVLVARRPDAKQLAPSEVEFVQRARNRRRALLAEAADMAAIQGLPEKYLWEAFLRDISSYVSKNFEAFTGIPASRPFRPTRVTDTSSPHEKEQPQMNRRRPRSFGKDGSPSGQSRERAEQATSTSGSSQLIHASFAQAASKDSQDDIAEKAAQAAQFAMQGFSTASAPDMPQQNTFAAQTSTQASLPEASQQTPKQNPPEIQYHFEHPLHPNVPNPPLPYYQNSPYQNIEQLQQTWHGQSPNPTQFQPSFSVSQSIPYPTQSAPTHVLYERARSAATSKVPPSNRRTGHPSQRRPWTSEEESALMAGLDRVKGPHWSQILAMFGPGGTINEILKDRNQVQLKDKARNLKLFFLKSGIEVPYYLQFVTGELKTRAPSRVAKNEAKEKGTTDEDRAHIEGLMALASRVPQEMDQTMNDMGNQNGNAAPNGHVPTADMGIGPGVNAAQGAEVPIDPEVTGEASRTGGASGFNTDMTSNGATEVAS